MLEYNVLRLSVWDAGQVGVTVYTEDPIDVFLRQQYLWNLEMFSTSQRLVLPVEDYQLTARMKDLTIEDLRAIRDTLNLGHIQRAMLPPHRHEWETTQTWTAPSER